MCRAELRDPALIRKPLKKCKNCEGGCGGRGPTPALLTLAELKPLFPYLATPRPWYTQRLECDSRLESSKSRHIV